MMLDSLKVYKSVELFSHIENRLNTPMRKFNLGFDPVFRYGQVVKYIAKLGNLYLSIREDQFTIQNSLTKFYHGNNYTNFTYSQLQQAITSIEEELGIPIRDARVINFEFGVVIEDNNIPFTLSRLGHYKGKPPLPMHSAGNTYGISYINSTHRIKIYDKTSEVKRREGINLDKQYLRVEKCYSRSHLNSLVCLKNNPINTLDDLLSWNTLDILSKDLITSLCKIEVTPLADKLERMSPMSLRRWCYLRDPFFRNTMKKHHPKAFKSDRREINKIIQDYRENGHDRLIEEVKNKLVFCLVN